MLTDADGLPVADDDDADGNSSEHSVAIPDAIEP
jgi:hypothetical protein